MTRIPTIAAGAIATTAMFATPAQAQIVDGDDIDDIAGAVIVGGLKALLGSSNARRAPDYRDQYYYDRSYDGQYYGGEYQLQYTRELIARCVNVAENEARRFGPANVTQVEEVDQNGRFLRVEGDIRVAQTYRRGSWGDYYYDDADEGEFECYVDRNGRVADISFDGLSYRRR